MTVQPVTDLNTTIGDVLRTAGTGGVLLEPEGHGQYAVLPLDDDLMDYLLERCPSLIELCREVRQRMQSGSYHTHEQVKEILAQQ